MILNLLFEIVKIFARFQYFSLCSDSRQPLRRSPASESDYWQKLTRYFAATGVIFYNCHFYSIVIVCIWYIFIFNKYEM